MNRLILLAVSVSILSVDTILAQAVSFSSPVSWLTQRNDSIFLRAQLDTASLKKKTISVSLFQVNEGKKKVLAKKNIKVTDNVMEISLANVGKDLIGGSEYLSLQWSVPDGEEKGVIEPIGILNLQKIQKSDQLKTIRVENGVKPASISGLLKDEKFVKIGANEFVSAWNKDAFFIILKKSKDNNILRFGFDGKNGKNAFISYPDRIISYKPAQDSIYTTHYIREIAADSLKYSEKPWHCELTKETIGDRVIISIPWADIGVIPFEERMVGFAAFSILDNGKVAASIPEKAQLFIPGTWTDIFLQK